MAHLFHYNPDTVRLTLLINDYKFLRDAVKTADSSDRDTLIYLRGAYEWALKRREVRVIHGISRLIAEEPSGALSDFLIKLACKAPKEQVSSIYGEAHHGD